MRVAGIDLGKASVGLVVVDVQEGAAPRVLHADSVAHGGKPFDLLASWYRDHHLSTCAALCATGIYADELGAPVEVLPEEACLQAALEADRTLPDTLNLVSIGGRGYRALSRRPAGEGTARQLRVRYLESDKCSSGTGENAQRMAARFGLSLEEADRLAREAQSCVAITARCSVFAKSEMTHHANEGRAAGDLFRGYFDSVARNARALLARCEVNGPVYLIGGCARLESLRTSLAERAGREVRLPEHHLWFEALGAALLAAERARMGQRHSLPAHAAELVKVRERRFQTRPPASQSASRVTVMPQPQVKPGAHLREPTILGLDLGSTGAKAVLTSVATGEVLFDAYDRTRGNPIAATQRLLRTLLEGGRPDVRAIGVTGSGRQAVATLLRAVFPEAGDRVAVLNEIVLSSSRRSAGLRPSASARKPRTAESSCSPMASTRAITCFGAGDGGMATTNVPSHAFPSASFLTKRASPSSERMPKSASASSTSKHTSPSVIVRTGPDVPTRRAMAAWAPRSRRHCEVNTPIAAASPMRWERQSSSRSSTRRVTWTWARRKTTSSSSDPNFRASMDGPPGWAKARAYPTRTTAAAVARPRRSAPPPACSSGR